jgi:hypothetical protein
MSSRSSFSKLLIQILQLYAIYLTKFITNGILIYEINAADASKRKIEARQKYKNYIKAPKLINYIKTWLN